MSDRASSNLFAAGTPHFGSSVDLESVLEWVWARISKRNFGNFGNLGSWNQVLGKIDVGE